MDSEFDRERGITPVRAHAELPLPATPLPRPNTNPRPFEIDAQPREFPRDSNSTHPFQIVVSQESSETRMRVRVGRAHQDHIQVVGGVTYHALQELSCLFNSTSDLLDDDFGPFGVAGYEVLSNSTTYGVFLFASQSGGAGSGPPNTTLEYQNIVGRGWTSLQVGVSTTYVSPSDVLAYAGSLGTPGYGALFLGRVTTDSSGNATILQYRKSDVALPAMILPDGFISAETGNNLQASFVANPGLWVQVVSPDADNSITPDANGAAYYDAP